MDNDISIIKRFKQFYKKVKFCFDYKNIDIADVKKGNEIIKDLLVSNAPFSVVRCGATEMRCINEYFKADKFSDKIKKEIFELSGVFPNQDENIKNFCQAYINSIKETDVLSLWGVGAESTIVKKHLNLSTKYLRLESLEPYYFSAPWSEFLRGKKVLVIHPFVKTIESQYARREDIFPGTDILPNFELKTLKAVQTIAGEKDGRFKTWFEALEFMKSEIDKIDFEVAIIGAGAYGLPLAVHVKSIGKQAIQMAGATQILFGIKGKRWDNHPIISKFYNEAWVRPSKEETPAQTKKVEGGSYW